MYRLACGEEAAQEIGFIYTTLLSALVLSAVTVSVSKVVTGNRENTAQEEVAQVLHRLVMAIEDVLETVRAYPDADIQMQLPVERNGILYHVVGTATGIKVIPVSPRGPSIARDIELAPATAIEGSISSTIVYILITYDHTAHVVRLSNR